MAHPKDDAGYLDRLSMAIFSAGLNWQMVENKWPGFKKAFADFSPSRIAKFTEEDVNRLMKDTRIVRNERKVRATIDNAKALLSLSKTHGSFQKYLESFGKDEKRLQKDLQQTFHHVGPSTARMFLWSSDYKLTPTAEEKKWMKAHHEDHTD